MKHTPKVKIEFDIQTLRRAVVLITGESITDEQIIERFCEGEEIKTDLGEEIMKRKTLKFIAKLLGQKILFLQDETNSVFPTNEVEVKTIRSQVRVDSSLLMSARTSAQMQNLKGRIFKEAMVSMIPELSTLVVIYEESRTIETECEIELKVVVPRFLNDGASKLNGRISPFV